MPLYEYVCEKDGTRIELLRPMSDADKPVDDPKNQGRRFTRVQSTFQAKGASGPRGTAAAGGGGCCPCGKSAGACSRA